MKKNGNMYFYNTCNKMHNSHTEHHFIDYLFNNGFIATYYKIEYYASRKYSLYF